MVKRQELVYTSEYADYCLLLIVVGAARYGLPRSLSWAMIVMPGSFQKKALRSTRGKRGFHEWERNETISADRYS